MTPQLALQPQIAASQSQTHLSPQSPHLTEDQLDQLLARSANCAASPAEAHLLACDQCAAELAGLREVQPGAQRDARAAWEERRPFREVLDADPAVTLTEVELDEAFDLSRTLRHADRFSDALADLE